MNRRSVRLFTAFAGLALLLATVGLYGLVSYAISLALGATRSDVSSLVVWQGFKPAVIGTVIGVAAAVLACRILRSQLFGVTPADPLMFALVPLVLLLVAATACYLPAIRAARLDPTVALRGGIDVALATSQGSSLILRRIAM